MNNKKIEFSKIVLLLVMALFFLVAIFGMALIGFIIYTMYKIQSISYLSAISTALGALFTFVGAPTSVSIGYYLWKSKNENINKYSNATTYVQNENERMNNDI